MKGIFKNLDLKRAIMLVSLGFAFSPTIFAQSSPLSEQMSQEIKAIDPHQNIRPLFDPVQNPEGLSLPMRLFPREILKAFERESQKSIEDSVVKRSLLKVLALRAIPEFQNPLDGISNLKEFASFESKDLYEKIYSKIDWADFARRISAVSLPNTERLTSADALQYLKSIDREFSDLEKTVLIVAIHLSYLKSMRVSLPDTQSEADLATLMQLEAAMEAAPDLCLQFLEVDANYRMRKSAQAVAFLNKYADREISEFTALEERVVSRRILSVFSNFRTEIESIKSLVRSVAHHQKNIEPADLATKQIAYLSALERLADAQDIVIWDWAADSDIQNGRLEKLLRSSHGEMDSAQIRWVIEKSQAYQRAQAAVSFEANRGSRALSAATTNGAWAVPVAAAGLLLAWRQTQNLIQLSDQMFRDEGILIAQAYWNHAGSTDEITALVEALSNPAAMRTSSFMKHLREGMRASDIGVIERAVFVPAQPTSEIIAQMPKGLNVAARDAITAAVQQRQYLKNFSLYISRFYKGLSSAQETELKFQRLTQKILELGSKRSVEMARQLAGGFNEISQSIQEAKTAGEAMRASNLVPNLMGTSELATRMAPSIPRVTVSAARRILQKQLSALQTSEAMSLSHFAEEISKIQSEMLKIVQSARYESYLGKVAAISAAAEKGSQTTKTLASFHRLASWFAYQAGKPIAAFRVSRFVKGMQYQPRGGISGLIDSYRSIGADAQFTATLPGMLTKTPRIINLGRRFVSNLPFVATVVGTGIYAWQVGSAYWKGDADQEFENYQNQIRLQDAARGIDTDSVIMKQMKPKNLDGLATELVRALNYNSNPTADSFNLNREKRSLPRLEIIMNSDSMADMNIETGFATYAYGLVKVVDPQAANSQSERARNIENGILVRFRQVQEGSNAALSHSLGITQAPARVFWKFDGAVALKSINADTQIRIQRAIYGSGDPGASVQIQAALADSLFGVLGYLWKPEP